MPTNSPTARDWRRTRLLLFLALAMVLYNVPYGSYVVWPFKLFATWVHEMSHGLTALAVGGHIQSLELHADTSGLVTYTGKLGRFRLGLVSSAGYLGTAFFGGLIVASQASRRWARVVLGLLAATLVVSAVLWVRQLFGFAACLGLAAALGFAAARASHGLTGPLLQFLGAQTCVNAVLDIRVLYSVSERSDAVTMAKLFWLPRWFWATAWMAIAVVALLVALRVGLRSSNAADERKA